jgi:hypothetical protein
MKDKLKLRVHELYWQVMLIQNLKKNDGLIYQQSTLKSNPLASLSYLTLQILVQHSLLLSIFEVTLNKIFELLNHDLIFLKSSY